MKKILIKYYLLFKNLPFLLLCKKPQILSFEATIDEIINKKKSFSRFGDGEIRMVLSQDEGIGFQKKNSKLTIRLDEVLKINLPNLLVGLPNTYKFLPQYTIDSQIFWYGFNYGYGKNFLSHINSNIKYGDSLITRFYIATKDKDYNRILEKINKLKSIWIDQDLLIVEGEKTRLGIGNDLFDNAKSIQRIICPSKNAFDRYDDILQTVKMYGVGKLILIALGPTATILAHDLAKDNFWALDIGHIDIEYMWFLQGAHSKKTVQGKFVNEVSQSETDQIDDVNIAYRNSIIITLK